MSNWLNEGSIRAHEASREHSRKLKARRQAIHDDLVASGKGAGSPVPTYGEASDGVKRLREIRAHEAEKVSVHPDEIEAEVRKGVTEAK